MWEMSDSREKLEKDLKTHLYEFGGYCFSSREGHTDNVNTFFDDFVSLLDRQAAITAKQLIGESDAPKSEETVENDTLKDDIRNFDYSREKLEAAAQTAAGYIYGRGFTNGLADAWNDDEVDTAANRIIQLLGRQAAIIERECREYENELRMQHYKRVENLTAELFGTPERAARTIAAWCEKADSCAGCPLFMYGVKHCEQDEDDTPSLLEWLKGDAEI